MYSGWQNDKCGIVRFDNNSTAEVINNKVPVFKNKNSQRIREFEIDSVFILHRFFWGA